MSASKKSSSSVEVTKPVSSKPSSLVGSKRSVGDIHSSTVSVGLEDWYPMNRRVFTTRGSGTLANVGKNGQALWCFTIVCHFADGKSAAVQAWRDKSNLFSEFFTYVAVIINVSYCHLDPHMYNNFFRRNCKPDDEPSVWVIPEARDNGCFFRLKDPGSYLINFLHVDYVLTADFGAKTRHPYPAITADDFPACFEWEDDMYELGGVLIPHYSLWGTTPASTVPPSPPVVIDMTPRVRTFAQESPTKSKAPKLNISSSSSGMRIPSAQSAISMDDEE